ncbi:hypothetical protein [Nitrosomonas sp.]|uniref:hypothetical protein n=1 Tax=Nitrosomonas sp. TaxID=42353 RepID=UPI00273144E2|nr:hypothetical protein [Nitrosomonas sp.]MDP1785875.1 hypothetical protein [Nitrosomonas sp.]
MKPSNILLVITISLFFSTAYATETLPEKGEAVSKDIKREANKAVDRIEEGTCTDTDVECTKKKLENRGKEGTDLIEDKSSEMKNKID